MVQLYMELRRNFYRREQNKTGIDNTKWQHLILSLVSSELVVVAGFSYSAYLKRDKSIEETKEGF